MWIRIVVFLVYLNPIMFISRTVSEICCRVMLCSAMSEFRLSLLYIFVFVTKKIADKNPFGGRAENAFHVKV